MIFYGFHWFSPGYLWLSQIILLSQILLYWIDLFKWMGFFVLQSNKFYYIPLHFWQWFLFGNYINQIGHDGCFKELAFSFRGESVSVRCSLLNRTPQPLESVVVLAASEDYSFIQVNILFMVVPPIAIESIFSNESCRSNPMDMSRVESLFITDSYCKYLLLWHFANL